MIVSCPTCQLLSRVPSGSEVAHCPRCAARLMARGHYSLQRTWALVIASAICYIPANTLPVLTTSTLRSSQSDTVLAGILYLYTSGSWPLALIVLIASVMIPVGKLVSLGYLLLSVQRGSVHASRERTRMFRLVEKIGRWSMLDIFVIAFVVALVQLPPLMTAQPGPGVPFFAAVVILTMIAAFTFDPRLIWDQLHAQQQAHG
jgi:paraquat-inducible protein A